MSEGDILRIETWLFSYVRGSIKPAESDFSFELGMAVLPSGFKGLVFVSLYLGEAIKLAKVCGVV